MSRPNVLLLFQDQLRYDVTAGAMCSTPVMDRLRREGTWFDRTYTPTALCSPARSTVLTGLYPHGTGVLRNVLGPLAAVKELPAEVTTIAETLREAGYATGYSGKWHLGTGAHAHGFDDVGMTDGLLESERFHGFTKPFHTGQPGAFWTTRENGSKAIPVYNANPVSEEDTPAFEVQRDVRALLRRYASGDRPFFVVASFFEPHWPYVLPVEWLHLYDPAGIEPWASFPDDFTGKPATMQKYEHETGSGALDWDHWRRIVAYYLGAVSYTDHLAGLVLDELDTLGLAGDTIVISTCDHGDMAGSHGMINKGAYLYEETYRIPMAVRWPGHVPAGMEHAGFTSLADVVPTILDATGLASSRPVHGRSLLPLADRTAPAREAIHCEYHGDELGAYDQRMIRRDDWKLIVHRDDPAELYDLAEDPAEMHNRADDPGLSAVRASLEEHLAELMAELDDPLGRWPDRLAARTPA